MNNSSFKNTIILAVLFLIVIILDQYTKSFISTEFITPNKGFIGGSGESLDPLYKLFIISVILGPLLFTLISQSFKWFYRKEHYILKVFISLILGGAISNLIDKIFRQEVIDFIPIYFSHYKITLNIADVFIQLGIISLLVGIIYFRKTLFFAGNIRTQIYINKEFQLYYSIKISVLIFFASFITGILALGYLILLSPKGENHITEFIVLWFISTLGLVLFGFFLSVNFSHKIIGPIYALKNHVQDLSQLKFEEFKLREDDTLPMVEDIGNLMTQTLRENIETKKTQLTDDTK